LSGILKRTAKRYQDPVLWVWLGIFFSSKRYLKGTAKAPAVDFLRLKTLRGTKTNFFTPKRYDEQPCHFKWESIPWEFAVTLTVT